MVKSQPSSRLSGFYKLSVDQRLETLKHFAGLEDSDTHILRGDDEERLNAATRMIENVAGLFHLPVGIGANFRLDGHDVLMPMVIEEPSVVAAASNAARLMRSGPGIVTEATAPLMIGQIQLCDMEDLDRGASSLAAASDELLKMANASAPRLVARGGGARPLAHRQCAL